MHRHVTRLVLVPAAVWALLVFDPAAARAADCNGNGQEDNTDIRRGASKDCNGNGRPDECDEEPVILALRGATAVTGRSSALAAADFDADGLLDLIAGGLFMGAGLLSVLVNQGDGAFLVAAEHPVGVKVLGVAAADVDGDGDPDLTNRGGGVDRSRGRW